MNLFKQFLKELPDLIEAYYLWFSRNIRTFIAVVLCAVLIVLALILACEGAEVDTTKAVIHHTASHDVSVDEIDRWHKERGWDGIGYHFVIRKDGTIEKGRNLAKKGTHAKGRNQMIGIVLTGYDSFTTAQTDALIELLRELDIVHIERHHENCPGDELDVEVLQKELNNEL